MELLQPEKPTEPHRKTPDSLEKPSHSDSQCSSHKKTRNLPNLTECHACGFKVDVCTGKNSKNRLQTLYSEWRVVLLCSKCFSSVESSRICSYCFSETSPDSFRCIQCRRSVHKDCFLKYRNTAPWSYACLDSEFSVCVDCWIPKPVAISRSRRSRVKGGVIKKKGKVMVEKGNFISKALEDVVKDANRALQKKVEVAARAREEAIKKAVVAKKAVELANNALSLVANREESSLQMDAIKALDGSALTFELHPNVDSSAMISKSCCLLNTSYLDNPKRLASSVDSSFKTLDSCNVSACDKREDSHKPLCEPLISVGSLDSGSTNDPNRHCMGKIGMNPYSNDGDRTAEFDAKPIGEELLKEGEGSCSDRLINYCREDSGLELDRKQADSALHGEERSNGQPDRYFLKYRRRRRRNCRVKPNLDCNPKVLYNNIYLESQESTVGVPLSCSGEMRTISNASFHSFCAPLQASACESGFFREPS